RRSLLPLLADARAPHGGGGRGDRGAPLAAARLAGDHPRACGAARVAVARRARCPVRGGGVGDAGRRPTRAGAVPARPRPRRGRLRDPARAGLLTALTRLRARAEPPRLAAGAPV